MFKRFKWLQLGIAVIAFFAFVILLIRFLLNSGAPNLAPMKHFKTVHGGGCFGMALASCQVSYYYVSEGSLTSVSQAVYKNLLKNSNYRVQLLDDNSIYVTYKNGRPGEQDITKLGFGIDFITAPKVSDQYRGFFVPTKNCALGAVNCVEAEVVK